MMAHFSLVGWLLLVLAGFLIGMSKAGIKGMDMLNVTIMALVIGAKASTGVMLPLLCVADILAVAWYHRHAQWQHILALAPWMLVGIIVGLVTGNMVNEVLFKKTMAILVLCAVLGAVLTELRRNVTAPQTPFFAGSMGLLAGFSTMMGNLAGAFANLYFLAMRVPKNEFIGTAAWLFFGVNLIKLPLQYFFWQNINATSLQIDLYVLPAMVAGFLVGVVVTKHLKADTYRKVIIAFTIIGAAFILLK